MVAAKTQDADRIVASPPKGVAFYLVYGPDTGLVTERAARLAAATADPADPFSLIKLDAAQISADPSRLADEAYAVSMFGGRRAILVRDGGSRAALPGILTGMLKNPPPETTIVVEAGDLKKSHQLRTLFERDRTAYAIPCYVDDDAAVGRLVDEEMRLHGLSIAPEARALLIAQLGGDRLLSRGEIQKLCLYAHGKGRVEQDDVMEMVGDSAGIAVDEVVDAAATGDLAGLGAALGRAAREGLDPGYIALSALRHFQILDSARSAVDGGRSPSDVVGGMRPPVFFKRKNAVTLALGLWTAPRLQKALALLSDTVRDARLNAHLGREIVGVTLITLASHAAAQSRRR